MNKLKFVAIAGAAAVALAIGTIAAGPAAARARSAGSDNKTVHIIGNYEKVGESPLAVPQFEDAAQLAIKNLKKQGVTVEYERIPGRLRGRARLCVHDSLVVSPAERRREGGAYRTPLRP